MTRRVALPGLALAAALALACGIKAMPRPPLPDRSTGAPAAAPADPPACAACTDGGPAREERP